MFPTFRSLLLCSLVSLLLFVTITLIYENIVDFLLPEDKSLF